MSELNRNLMYVIGAHSLFSFFDVLYFYQIFIGLSLL